MKELLPRTFVVDHKEFVQRMALPEGDLAGLELNPDGSVTISLVGTKK